MVVESVDESVAVVETVTAVVFSAVSGAVDDCVVEVEPGDKQHVLVGDLVIGNGIGAVVVVVGLESEEAPHLLDLMQLQQRYQLPWRCQEQRMKVVK